MLIGNNIFCIKGFFINLSSTLPQIQNCDINIILNAKHYAQYLKRKILAIAAIFISPKSKILIFFKQMLLPNSCNFLFDSFSQAHFTLYAHFVNHIPSKILIKNNADYLIQILNYYKLSYIMELLYKSCFAALIGHKIVSFLFTSLFLFHKQSNIIILPNVSSLDIKIPNSIKIYTNKDVVKYIIYLINKYPSI